MPNSSRAINPYGRCRRGNGWHLDSIRACKGRPDGDRGWTAARLPAASRPGHQPIPHLRRFVCAIIDLRGKDISRAATTLALRIPPRAVGDGRKTTDKGHQRTVSMKTVACCRVEPNSAGIVIRQLQTSEEHNGFQVYAKVNADTGGGSRA
jgi:hypothetical protein